LTEIIGEDLFILFT